MAREQAQQHAARVLGPEALAESQAHVRDAARAAPWWEADVVPIAGTFGNTRTSGSLAIVGAAGFILDGEVITPRPVGAAARAAAVLAVVNLGARKTGVLPERLRVRDEAIAGALRPELDQRGVQVEVAPMPELDDALDGSLEHLAGSRSGARGSAPWTWGETEASPAELAELHAAAAEFHRSAPWLALDGDDDTLLLTFPGEPEAWAASVMGSAGMHEGLALYSDVRDLMTLMDLNEEDPGPFLSRMKGISLSLSYSPASELAREMRREVAAEGWEVAGTAAYPHLMGISIPGRRITADHVRRIAAACRAVTELSRHDHVELPWTSPATGIGIDLVFSDDEEDDEGVDGQLPWPELEESHLIGAEGPTAATAAKLPDPEGALAIRNAEDERLERFAAWLDARKTSRAARDRMLRTGRLWADLLGSHPIAAEAATEADLRVFVFGYLPDHARLAKAVMKHLAQSLTQLFRFYREREGFWYPWAEGVVAEFGMLSQRAPDVREVLASASPLLMEDLHRRALRPVTGVPGTRVGWLLSVGPLLGSLRMELWRHWALWHDEVVSSGITVPAAVRDVLVGRQRQWENTPHPRLGGRTPAQLLKAPELSLIGDDTG